LGNIFDKVYENIEDNAAATDILTLPDIQAQILHKYLAIQGERHPGAPAYTQKRFVNAAYSKHVRFKADGDLEDPGESRNASETDEDDIDEQLRAIYATKSRRPPPKPNKHAPPLPLIPKEQYDQLPEQVKQRLKQQHAYFCNIYNQEASG